MAIIRIKSDTEDTFMGVLKDNCDTEPTSNCPAFYRGYVCTLDRHSVNYPHVAGNGDVIVAVWWDSENTR